MTSILMVCTHNRFRSALAEHMLRGLIGSNGGWQVSSAGTWADEAKEATPEAIEAGKDRGFQLEKHRSRAVTEQILREADLVVTMERGHKEALMMEFPWLEGRMCMLSEVCGQPAYDIPDPYFSDESPEIVADEINSLLRDNFRVLLNHAFANHINNRQD